MIHPRELEILNILWGSDKALTSMDIVNAGNGLSQSTVQAILRKLLKNDMVTVDGITHSNTVVSRTYRPTERSKVVVLHQFVEQYKGISNIVSKDEVIKALGEASLEKMKGEEYESL